MASNYDYLQQPPFQGADLSVGQANFQQQLQPQPGRRASQKAAGQTTSPSRQAGGQPPSQPSRSASRAAQPRAHSAPGQQELPQFGPQQSSMPQPTPTPPSQQPQLRTSQPEQSSQYPVYRPTHQHPHLHSHQTHPPHLAAQTPQPHRQLQETPTGASPLSQPLQDEPITPLSAPSGPPHSLFLGPYDSREDAFASAQEYAFAQGYCLVNQGSAKSKSTNGKYNPLGDVVRVDLMCDRGGVCNPSGKGIRKRGSNRTNCPCKMKLVYNRSKGHKWYISIRSEEHNHELLVGRMHENASYRRYQRIQTGGSRLETPAERYRRVTKDKLKAASVPAPPSWHTPGAPADAGAAASSPATAIASTATTAPAASPSLAPTNPLHLAAMRGQEKMVAILLSKGADVNAVDATGKTPLHYATEAGSLEIVKLLIDRGADVSRKDARGTSILATAVDKNLEDVVVMLIENGADPNV